MARRCHCRWMLVLHPAKTMLAGKLISCSWCSQEWLNSLPKHHQLYRAFDWTPPQFGHLPLLVNPDGTKLSKRTGDVRVEHYRKAGYEPEALLNFLALMGWDHHTALESILSGGSGSPSASTSSLPTGPDHGGPETSILPPQSRSDNHSLYEVFSVPQLIGAFDLAHVNHRKAAVNMSKLDFLNKMTLRRRAGRLGEDGVMVSLGKKSDEGAAGEEGRKELVERLQMLLKERDLFAGWSVPRLDLRGGVDVATATWSTTSSTWARCLMPSW